MRLSSVKIANGTESFEQKVVKGENNEPLSLLLELEHVEMAKWSVAIARRASDDY